MSRLTERDEHGNAYYPRCFKEPCNGGGCTKNMCDFAVEVCDKLAAYEDTGLDPEQLSVIDEEYSKMAKELAELRKYKQLGTLEGVREAVEKQRAKRPKTKMLREDIKWWCPNCGERHVLMYAKKGFDYCQHCGQKMDWRYV